MSNYYLERAAQQRSLLEQLVAKAMRLGGAEASTEAVYTKALQWLEDQRPNADSDTEKTALEQAITQLSAKLEHMRHPEKGK